MEASGCLVAPAASKADVTEQLGQAGSIPVRLRHVLPATYPPTTMTDDPDRRRRVPRTDALLDDPRLAAAAARLGRDLVKDAVRGVQQRIRDGEVDPDDAVDAVRAALPARPSSLLPVLNAPGRGWCARSRRSR